MHDCKKRANEWRLVYSQINYIDIYRYIFIGAYIEVQYLQGKMELRRMNHPDFGNFRLYRYVSIQELC
jgi:hypothetical protein